MQDAEHGGVASRLPSATFDLRGILRTGPPVPGLTTNSGHSLECGRRQDPITAKTTRNTTHLMDFSRINQTSASNR
jgi:hypothetical protein